MTFDVTQQLEKEEVSEQHQALLTHAMGLVKLSRAEMSKNYSTWDHQDQVYRGELSLDAEQKDLARKGKPLKMIVPHTFAQCHTFTSFLFLMFNQNRTFFELSPSGDEDHGEKRKDMEKVLERDLRKNQWNNLLYQHLLDLTRFGPSIVECAWTRKLSRIHVSTEPTMANVAGMEFELNPGSEWRDFVKYEGNALRVISPYKFFPDPRFPLVDFQRGEFCACEEEFSMGALRELESVGEVAGVDHIKPLPADMSTLRGGQTRSAVTQQNDFIKNSKFDASNSSHNAVVTKCQIWIVPSKFKWGSSEKPLGPETFPILYHLWYANDNRIIRLEPAGWWHNEFGWSVAQFTPDMHRTVNLGLADLIYRLQDVISWFVNSHITSVRRVMQNRLIVDPRLVDTGSLDGEKDIYLRQGAQVSALDRAVGQLKVQDVTGAHMNDVDSLGRLMELVTGVNGNAMGQYNGGRRSAQEARVVTAGAAGRMKLHGHLIWESSLAPLAKQMLSNSRQMLSEESFRWVVGKNVDPQRFLDFKGTPEEVVCGDDYAVFDSTLASEKGFMAQSLSELFQAIMSTSPIAAQRMGMEFDPMKMLDEIQYLRGGGNVSRFKLSPEEQMMAQQQAMMQQLQNAPQNQTPA